MAAINIPAEARHAMGLIESAKVIMRHWISSGHSMRTSIEGFISRLDTVWLNVSEIQKHPDEHMPAELEQALEAFRHARPGNLHCARGNNAKDSSQINGALGGTESSRRQVVESENNSVDNGFQSNRPIYGDADALMAAINIPTEASCAMAFIDSAKGIMRGWVMKDCSLDTTVQGFIKRLDKVWLYVSEIQKQTDEHTPAVGTALATLRGVTQKLNWWPVVFTLVDVGNVVKELDQALQALRLARPGDLHRAEGNKARIGKGTQVNGALAAKQSDRRLVVEAIANEVENQNQINAPIFGNPNEVAIMLQALNGTKP
ncbi:hypothetical protein MY1884_009023 [Beauveria asiatica]